MPLSPLGLPSFSYNGQALRTAAERGHLQGPGPLEWPHRTPAAFLSGKLGVQAKGWVRLNICLPVSSVSWAGLWPAPRVTQRPHNDILEGTVLRADAGLLPPQTRASRRQSSHFVFVITSLL